MRRVASFVAASMMFGVCLLLPTSAWANNYISLAWGDEATSLVWRPGNSATAIGSFVGAPVVVPGDSGERTAYIRNDGPTTAKAVVEIVNVTKSANGTSVNHELDSLIHLTWHVDGESHDMTWRSAIEAGNPTWAVAFTVAQGEVFDVTAGYFFPVDATGGRNCGHPSHALSFDVRVTLSEDIPHPTPPGVDVETGGVETDRVLPVVWPGLVALLTVSAGLWLTSVWFRNQRLARLKAR